MTYSSKITPNEVLSTNNHTFNFYDKFFIIQHSHITYSRKVNYSQINKSFSMDNYNKNSNFNTALTFAIDGGNNTMAVYLELNASEKQALFDTVIFHLDKYLKPNIHSYDL